MLVTFAKVFKATGTKNGKSWTRWDYKTESDQRYVLFAGDAEIPLETLVNIEVNDRDAIQGWEVAEEQKTTSNGSQAVSEAPVASQGHPDEREKKIHRQTASKVAAELLKYFPEEEQTLETFFSVTENLVSYYANGVKEAIVF